MEDVREAAITFNVGALQSCVVMCGRALQGILLDKEIKDAKLEKMIEDAHYSVLGEELYRTAKAVQYFRNTGAHPQNPSLRSVTPMQAALSLHLVVETITRRYPESPTPASQSETDNNEQ